MTKNLKTDYGAVTSATLNKAITDARTYFTSHPNAVYTITIPEGSFSIPDTIDVSNVQPGPNGQLVITGAGMDHTTIVQSGDTVGILGTNTYRTTFSGIHFTVPNQTTTQGNVVAVAPGQVTISVPVGFPTPIQVIDPHYDLSQACPQDTAAAEGWGRYMKVWTDSTTDPHIMDENQSQIAWCKPVAVVGSSSEWTILLKKDTLVAPYPIGSLISLKSKNMESAYQFCGGSDFEFKDIKWTERSRGIWHCSFNNVHLDGDVIARGPAINGQVPVLSSPGGGPQLGELGKPSSGHVIENCNFDATGDDAIAFFDASGSIKNTQVSDAYGRINLNQNPNVQLSNNTFIRTRVVKQ
ncbi:hypothetical protein H0X32_03930 [Patescibacteria group bacterium]|nr:hypothetical protein [Patescibacteria group bacterium]